MKYIKRIIFILLLIITLSSCNKKDNKEIKYTLYENVELGECDEFDLTFDIPTHQYVHITFTKNTNWIIYHFRMYDKQHTNLLSKALTRTNMFPIDIDEDQRKIEECGSYNNADIFLGNGDYYLDVYNDKDDLLEIGCTIYNSKDYAFSNEIGCNEHHKFPFYWEAVIYYVGSSYNHNGEIRVVNYSGPNYLTMKILDSNGNEVDSNIIKDYNQRYYICIYKNQTTSKVIEFDLYVEYGEIYDGYEFEITTVNQDTYNINRYVYNCDETGYYDITTTNSYVTIGLYDGMNNIISFPYEQLNNILMEKGKKYYFFIVNKNLSDKQIGKFNIIKYE